MRWMRSRWRAFRNQQHGAAVVEFALVVPIFFLLVWGGLSFSRAYQRLNVLTGALREGARYGATLSAGTIGAVEDSARARITIYSTAFGFPVDPNQVTAALVGNEVRVSVTNYPLFADLTGFSVLSTITVTRQAIFRWERS
ncbi:MAG: pilus assembly protein [Gemmatimonadaceae bacterium]|nr:pilus assembly protein [Gemmatimonadaceae bacterium]